MRHIFAALALFVIALPVSAATRPVIRSRADLPPVRFPASVPSRMLGTPAMRALLPKVRIEAERLLRDYDVQDTSLRGELQIGLSAIAIIEGRQADANRWITQYRSEQTKPQLQRLGEAPLDVAAVIAGSAAATRCSAGARRYTEMLSGTDAQLVRDTVAHDANIFQIAGAPFFAGTAVGMVDPTAKQRGSIDVLDGTLLAIFEALSTVLPPCRTDLTFAARTWLDTPANAPRDIWPARQPDAAAMAGAQPVNVAVWDHGYDVTLFPGQLAVDPAEPLDGRDNDGNGIADDWNGPAWDLALRPTSNTMLPPTEFLHHRLAAQVAYDKGELDLQFGFDTPEAALFAAFTRTGTVDEQADEFLAHMENSIRSHGTACASEIADGAPYVRLYNVAALPWGWGEDHQRIPYDEAVIARWASAINTIGKRLNGAGVRAVNMSWVLTKQEILDQLLDRGLETDPARAMSRASAMQTSIARALEALVRGSPNILFVVAAGNSDQSDAIQSDATQNFSAPNLLIVGATGTNGKPTSFTVFGPTVAIYAQGEAVPLRWPGNVPIHSSGTSMAAPLVVRAAAQMLAVAPKLTAAQVRAGLIESATSEDGGLKLLHPAAAVRWAKNTQYVTSANGFVGSVGGNGRKGANADIPGRQ